MKFSREWLQELEVAGVNEGGDHTGDVISIELVDYDRWSLMFIMIFKYNSKFYEVSYSRGATEYQMEDPFESDDDEIDCLEVEQVEFTGVKWEAV